MMRSMPPLPSFTTRPRENLPIRGRRRRAAAPATVDGLVGCVIAAVNARGLCAADLARLAHLPESEVGAMATRCGCRGCFLLRAN
jgi:hypothetical protein